MAKEYKTFNDLEFHTREFYGEGHQAKMLFDNGYGISVVRFKFPKWDLPAPMKLFNLTAAEWGLKEDQYFYGSYTNNDKEWEVGLLVWDGNTIDLATDEFDFMHGDNVMGYLLAPQVTEIMRKIQELPAREHCYVGEDGVLRLVIKQGKET